MQFLLVEILTTEYAQVSVVTTVHFEFIGLKVERKLIALILTMSDRSDQRAQWFNKVN